jgi:hypothetical protein
MCAQVKLTELTELTTPAPEDVLVIVDDIAGTATTKKVTEKNLYNARKLMSIVPAANFALGTGTSVQSAFPTTGDVITLEGSTTYEMEGQYFITKSGTTCTTGLAFALGGGASITSMKYIAQAQNVAKNTTGATIGALWVDQVAATVVNATATTDVAIQFKGLIRMNAGGTVTPQIIFSAAPTSPVMVADSYIKFTKIGTNTENIIGSVA